MYTIAKPAIHPNFVVEHGDVAPYSPIIKCAATNKYSRRDTLADRVIHTGSNPDSKTVAFTVDSMQVSCTNFDYSSNFWKNVAANNIRFFEMPAKSSRSITPRGVRSLVLQNSIEAVLVFDSVAAESLRKLGFRVAYPEDLPKNPPSTRKRSYVSRPKVKTTELSKLIRKTRELDYRYNSFNVIGYHENYLGTAPITAQRAVDLSQDMTKIVVVNAHMYCDGDGTISSEEAAELLTSKAIHKSIRQDVEAQRNRTALAGLVVRLLQADGFMVLLIHQESDDSIKSKLCEHGALTLKAAFEKACTKAMSAQDVVRISTHRALRWRVDKIKKLPIEIMTSAARLMSRSLRKFVCEFPESLSDIEESVLDRSAYWYGAIKYLKLNILEMCRCSHSGTAFPQVQELTLKLDAWDAALRKRYPLVREVSPSGSWVEAALESRVIDQLVVYVKAMDLYYKKGN